MEKNIFLGFIDEFFDFVEELKQYNDSKQLLKKTYTESVSEIVMKTMEK